MSAPTVALESSVDPTLSPYPSSEESPINKLKNIAEHILLASDKEIETLWDQCLCGDRWQCTIQFRGRILAIYTSQSNENQTGVMEIASGKAIERIKDHTSHFHGIFKHL